ncbi:hypothetical protein OU994_22040 [Pseudoduganella sp. SL102]|uniref:hypothetical protein n=1 Tax=Pseudoduganella sp. SL102 TaxID=2995154 RepID=UPI00248BD224|nr:hypothetical protein [Pseudoduganella sp. SL102]WBS00967.1 hypothetical protein OU994_22040 [Pseudoduganella sp. SL102]
MSLHIFLFNSLAMTGLALRYYFRATHGAWARTNGRTGPARAVDSSHETFGMEEVEPGMAMPGEMGFMVSDVSFLVYCIIFAFVFAWFCFVIACFVCGKQPGSVNCWPGPILGGQPKTIQSNFTNLQYHFWYRMLTG